MLLSHRHKCARDASRTTRCKHGVCAAQMLGTLSNTQALVRTSSSMLVFPTSRAPASSSACTAQLPGKEAKRELAGEVAAHTSNDCEGGCGPGQQELWQWPEHGSQPTQGCRSQ